MWKDGDIVVFTYKGEYSDYIGTIGYTLNKMYRIVLNRKFGYYTEFYIINDYSTKNYFTDRKTWDSYIGDYFSKGKELRNIKLKTIHNEIL